MASTLGSDCLLLPSNLGSIPSHAFLFFRSRTTCRERFQATAACSTAFSFAALEGAARPEDEEVVAQRQEKRIYDKATRSSQSAKRSRSSCTFGRGRGRATSRLAGEGEIRRTAGRGRREEGESRVKAQVEGREEVTAAEVAVCRDALNARVGRAVPETAGDRGEEDGSLCESKGQLSRACARWRS